MGGALVAHDQKQNHQPLVPLVDAALPAVGELCRGVKREYLVGELIDCFDVLVSTITILCFYNLQVVSESLHANKTDH